MKSNQSCTARAVQTHHCWPWSRPLARLHLPVVYRGPAEWCPCCWSPPSASAAGSIPPNPEIKNVEITTRSKEKRCFVLFVKPLAAEIYQDCPEEPALCYVEGAVLCQDLDVLDFIAEPAWGERRDELRTPETCVYPRLCSKVSQRSAWPDCLLARWISQIISADIQDHKGIMGYLKLAATRLSLWLAI